jgi:uncharacterized protein (DUF1778 family)
MLTLKLKSNKGHAMPRQTTLDMPTHAVNLRIRSDIRSLIDRAAMAYGKTRSDFMIDAARRAAEDALLDQTLVRVDQQTYDHFLSVLDQPPSGVGFDRLLKAGKPWAR